MKFKYRWWGKGDIDASIGIFFDGFSKILSATGHHALCVRHAGGHRAGEDCARRGPGHFCRATCGIFTRRGPWPKKSTAKT